MASLRQALEGIPITLHCHKIIELLQSPSVQQDAALSNHALQYLRIKAIKGDVEAKVKLGTLLDGQLLEAIATTPGDHDSSFWKTILDKAEAEIWGKSLFDRWLSSALAPCLALVESDLLLRQKGSSSTSMNGKSGSNHQDEDNDSDDHKGDNTSTSGHDARHFRLLDAILACADDEEKPATDDDSKLQQQKRSRIKGDMCYLVGLMRLKGVGLDKDLSLAVMYFEKASKLGHDGASYQLAMMMEDQYTYPDLYDIDQSVALYEKMITSKRKKKTAGTSKSSSSSSLSTTASTSTAVASVGNGGILTLSGPDASALIKLARVYYEGNHQGESRNLDKAYQYARKVAESTGEKYCQFMVGDILLQRKDIQQSLFWLTQSGQQGFPLAIEALARVYFEGIPLLVKQDYELAHEWCLKGDDIWPSGLGYCQSCLGDMYRQGLGVPKDQMKSFEYYQKAASQQDAPQNYARYMLGELFYNSGDMLVRNIPVAKDYYQIAARDQYEPARQRLLEIETLEQQEQEQKAALQTSRKPWRIMSLFGGRRKLST